MIDQAERGLSGERLWIPSVRLFQLDSEIYGDGLWNVPIWDVMDTAEDTLCHVYA